MELSADPSAYGKDKNIPFIGQVEDVNDPKRSNRVKVRCLNWHPPEKDGENGISTDDLPWARVMLPTTAAQQNRIGAKHRLLPGVWVHGFFADGSDANDAYITSSYGFTAKASDDNNRQDVDVSTGKIPDDVPGFTKINPVYGEGLEVNTGILTEGELKTGKDDQGDVAHDSILDDSNDGGKCKINRSGFTDTKEKPKQSWNPHSQIYNTGVADALCGSAINGREQIQNIIAENMPSGIGRFVDGDNTFDINGNVINMNGIMRKISEFSASILKQAVQDQKAFIQKTVNKTAHSTGIFAAASRSPITAEVADQILSVKFDTLNSVIDRSLDGMVDQILSSLQNINNQQKSSKGSTNETGELGSSPESSILDVTPLNITDGVITDVELSMNETAKKADEESDEKVSECVRAYNEFNEFSKNMIASDYECEEDMNDAMTESYEAIVKEIDKATGGGGGGGGGGAAGFIQMLTNFEFTSDPLTFNKSLVGVLDMVTGAGCNPQTMYNTATGMTGSNAGSSGAGEGGGSESGKSSKNFDDVYKSIGFGGKPGDADPAKSTLNPIGEEATTQKIGQMEREDILSTIQQWAPVDFHETNRKYELSGEVEFNDVSTNSNRVLVDNQDDPTENGIWRTSARKWSRDTGATDPQEFTTKKVVLVKSSEPDDMYFYDGKRNPKLNMDPIKFDKVFPSTKFTQPEKNALNSKVESAPDGMNAIAYTASRPSSDTKAASNYVMGIPNRIVIKKPGLGYYYKSKKTGRNFPSIFIDGYVGTPVPVVDKATGELVSILFNEYAWGNKPTPSISVISDDSSIGITTDDSNYDVFVSEILVENTGVGYGEDTQVIIRDKDRNIEGAIVRPKIKDGRIVSIKIINNGSGFKRLPKILIKNTGGGKGAKLRAVMGLKVKEQNPATKKLEQNVTLSITPSRVNLYTKLDV